MKYDIEPPQGLKDAGAAWARQEFISDKVISIQAFLGDCYGRGLEIANHHRGIILDQIEAAGGIRVVTYAPYKGLMNVILCNNGQEILASRVLKAPILERNLSVDSPPGVTQSYEVEVRFGGPRLGVSPELFSEIDFGEFISDKPLEYFLTPGYRPDNICIAESVKTAFDGRHTVSTDLYSVSIPVWHPSASPVFNASYEQTGKDGKVYKSMFPFVNEYGIVREKDVAMEKLIRFRDLLDFCCERARGNEQLGLLSPLS